MSFWEVQYTENGEKKVHRATRMYPKGQESTFGGEGEGTNYIADYNWRTKIWHRFVLYSWKDIATGKTFVGEWLQNLSTKKWTLFAVFNTKLVDSYITGGLSQFQENFYDKYYPAKRSFNIKNMYAYDRVSKAWVSLNTSTLAYDPASWKYNTAGTHEIGYTKDYFYGSAGLPVDDQKVYDASNPLNIKGTINQPNSPSFGKPVFKSASAFMTTSKLTVNWEMDPTGSPCYKYEISVYQVKGSTTSLISLDRTIRAYDTTHIINSTFKGNYKISLKCIGISGDDVTKDISKSV